MGTSKQAAIIEFKKFCLKEDKVAEIITSAGNFKGKLLADKQVKELFDKASGINHVTITLKNIDDDQVKSIFIEEIIAFSCL